MSTKDNTYTNIEKRLYFLSDDVDNSSIYYWDDNKSDENSILVYKVGCIKGNFNNLSEHIMAIIK